MSISNTVVRSRDRIIYKKHSMHHRINDPAEISQEGNRYWYEYGILVHLQWADAYLKKLWTNQ